MLSPNELIRLFWRAVQNDTVIPEALRWRLEVFRRHFPTYSTRGTSEVWMFRDLSWTCVLLGMGFNFDTPVVTAAALAGFQSIVRNKRAATSDLLNRLPNHCDHLQRRIYASANG